MKKYLILFALLLIQSCSSSGDGGDSPSTSTSALIGTWIGEGCLYVSPTDNYFQFRRVFNETTRAFTVGFHDVPGCSDEAYQSVFFPTENGFYTVGGAVTTSSGLSAIEIDYTDVETGNVFYSIYKIDALGRLFTGVTVGVNDGSTEERRNVELSSSFHNKQFSFEDSDGDGIDNNCDGQIDNDLDLASGNYECISMITSEGTIELALDKINAPNTVNNFVSYTNTSFYDGTIFHRVIDGFVIQGGGFDEIYNQKITNAPIDNEANCLLNVRGAIAMARTPDPHSATSQFFINSVDNAFLNFTSETADGWGNAVFGQVVTGINVVDIISKVSTGTAGPFASDVPLENLVIQTVRVIPCSSVTQ